MLSLFELKEDDISPNSSFFKSYTHFPSFNTESISDSMSKKSKKQKEIDRNMPIQIDQSLYNCNNTPIDINSSIHKNAKKQIDITSPIQKESKNPIQITPPNKNNSKNLIKITLSIPNNTNKSSNITQSTQSAKNEIKITRKNDPNTSSTNKQSLQIALKKEKVNAKKKKAINLMIPIEKEPVCIAIGDIEGDIRKLKLICKFIKMNPQLSFVFIGDIIDNISDGINCEANWSCISLIVKEFLHDDVTYVLDNEPNQNYSDNKKVISLPSGFKQINFGEKKYEDITNRVKFIAGNAEYECLSDFQKNYYIEDGKYVFRNKKWKKTVTFEQMCLIHRYLSNCNGVITMKRNQSNNYNNNIFRGTVYFRHWIEKFHKNRISNKIFHQETNIELNDIRSQNFIFITGHTRLFASAGPEEINNQEMYYFIDSTSFKTENKDDIKYPHEIRGRGENDNRMALISFEEENGFSVEGISLPFKYK